ncbi:hypothetical protein GCM10019059_36820 [Camelimonas fluminis]|uniref:Uncharacterized protein n=1 Tax=Camelimonas fluminis TaxID=1576911 RepID=A0ABV7UII7_9HYPH|nr:hypothetical protein [Camelimonas fluminis]GHE73902.1 hypothetical protein GCM10019059_36820 [Camelimonas fluminis]
MDIHKQALSDVALDTALVALMALFAALGVPGPGIALFFIMAALTTVRASGHRDLYDQPLARIGFKAAAINSSVAGVAWRNYILLRWVQQSAKPTNAVKGIRWAWNGYGRLIGDLSYWAMPFILAFGFTRLHGAYALCLTLVGVHILGVFAQFAQIRAWARNNPDADVPRMQPPANSNSRQR